MKLATLTLAAIASACDGSGSTTTPAPGHDAGDGSAEAATVPGDVLMQHNDLGRTGTDLSETILTTANVKSSTFGRLFDLPVDGLLFAQPLYVSQTTVGGKKRNVLIVATAHNSVYAFDADVAGGPLWHVNLGPALPEAEIIGHSDNILVEEGILSTPVIDRANGLIYVTCITYVDGSQPQSLHVLDLATGTDVTGSPVTIEASMSVTGPNAPTITFDSTTQTQRPSLLLLNGVVYLAFASHGDVPSYHGWIMSYRYDKDDESLEPVKVFNTSPDGARSGIWQGGQGLAADGDGFIYAMTGNGSSTATDGGSSYANAYLKLTGDLSLVDWFMPQVTAKWTTHDLDFGAGGPVLLPGTSLVIGAGKAGVLIMADTRNLGHFGNGTDDVVQSFPITNSFFGAPAVWSAGGTTRMYIWGVRDTMKGFLFSGGKFDTTPFATTTVSTPSGYSPVGVLSVTSNGSKDGTGIVWANYPNGSPTSALVPGTLYAFDALTLTELWDSLEVASRDDFGDYAKFVAPTVANGKVYMATSSKQVVVYGLLQ